MLNRLVRRLSSSKSPSRAAMSSQVQLTTRPANWKAAAPPPLPNTITFTGQSALPKLPVPELSDTLTRLKDAIKPLAYSADEYAAAEKKIDAFGTGIGKTLHERLLKRQSETDHWLEQWWDDLGYLGYRDSVVVNVSYYYGFNRQPSYLPQTTAARAAGIARAALIFRHKLKQGLIKPDGTKEGPHCMDTYRWMFDCCRVPGPEAIDWSVTYAKEGQSGLEDAFITVFRQGRVWKVDAIKDGKILSVKDLEKQIQFVYDNTKEEYPGVGILTSNNRDVWAKDYAELASSPKNADILEIIHSAAFSISLDSTSPSGQVAHSRDLWHGGVADSRPVGLLNRWVDKPVQFVIFDNAEAGIMGEHSVMDGTPTARMCDEILDWLHDPAFDQGSSISGLSDPTPLDFEVSPKTKAAIGEASKAAMELINSQTLSWLKTKYGKAAIKKFGISPDSWAQMIVQLAYRRLVGDKRVGGTYEAATTRKFYKGRTEAIKVVTSESDAFTKSMDDPSSSAVDRKGFFDAAAKKHISLAKLAGNGLGIDRHLFGMKLLLKDGEEIPEVFSDAVVKRASYWVLSTSAIHSKHFPVYGWGEVVPDGYGVAYVTGYDDRLQYTITSRAEMPNAQFAQEIAKAAEDIYDLHASAMKSKL